MTSWAAQELSGVDLGDERLNKRCVKLLERLGEKPSASIPGACSGWAETQAAYRLLSQDEVGWQDILEPHIECARQRMHAHPVVLCIQDTTELDFNGQTTEGLGRLSYPAQRGMYLHATLAVSPSREPLGVLDAWMWAREPVGTPAIKESLRWIEGYERVAEMAAQMPANRLVYVADREADFTALMQRAQALGTPADWLIRASHARRLADHDEAVWEHVQDTPSLGCIQFQLPAATGRAARLVTQDIRVARVTLKTPTGAGIEATAVLARESTPQPRPLEWKLLTNRSVVTLEEAAELIDWYRARWEIEMFFNVLKNGCKVQALQLATICGRQGDLVMIPPL